MYKAIIDRVAHRVLGNYEHMVETAEIADQACKFCDVVGTKKGIEKVKEWRDYYERNSC